MVLWGINYLVKKDTTILNNRAIDTLLEYNIFRSEIYMLVHAINLKKADTLTFKSLVPSGLDISDAKLFHKGIDKISVPYLKEVVECDIFQLKTDGKMPNNLIFISKNTPKQIIKFFVPDAKLSIELVDIKK